MHFITQTLMGLADATGAVADAAVVGEAAGEAATAVGGAADIVGLVVPMVLMFAVFYFLLIRPLRKKDKKVKDMLSALKMGDRICTIGGIYGTITSIKDDTFEVSVGKDNVKLVFARWAIRNVEEVSVENDGELLN